MKSRSKQFKGDTLPSTPLHQQDKLKVTLGNGKTSSQLKFILWNVNGIRSVLNKNAMRTVIINHQPHFICINETKINAELYAKEKIKIPTYHDYWNFCKCSAGYSGVAVFAKFPPISVVEDLEEPAFSQEGRVLTLEYEHFYLVVVYMPSAGDRELKRLHYKTKKYQVAFQSYCEKLKERALKEGRGVIVSGDFNVSHEQIDIHMTAYTHKQPGFTADERMSFKRFLNKGWVDTFRKLNPDLRQYTWWRQEHHLRDKNIGRRLDYFIVNQSLMPVVQQAKVFPDIQGSDHCPVYLEVNFDKRISLVPNKTIKLQEDKEKEGEGLGEQVDVLLCKEKILKEGVPAIKQVGDEPQKPLRNSLE